MPLLYIEFTWIHLFKGKGLRPRGAIASELCIVLGPPFEEGAGNAGSWLHPRPPRGKVAQKRALTKQVQPEQSGIPCAVVYGLLRDLPGEPA
jgi:hypothetical protein